MDDRTGPGRAEHGPTAAEVGEFALIRRMAGGPVGERPGVLVDTGDDAAVLAAPGGHVVACTDMLVQGRHFRLDWSRPADVGRKAIAQNAADIAAMGGACTGFLVAVGCPPGMPARVLEEVSAGARAEAAAAGAAIVGGDLVQASELVLSVTALGTVGPRRPVLRSGARAGDVLAMAGVTGASAAGWALLRGGPAGPARLDGAVRARLVAAHRAPSPPYAAGVAAAEAGATAMIDVSDGLAADLAHVAEESGAVLRLDPALLAPWGAAAGPDVRRVGDDLRAAAAALDADPWRWVLGGGEDHALAAALPAGTALPAGWRPIGTVEDPAPGGAPAVLVGDAPYRGTPGWRAFD